LSRSNCAGSIGWLTFPHHTLASLELSLTTNLSFGERPVCWRGHRGEWTGCRRRLTTPDGVLYNWEGVGFDKCAAGNRHDRSVVGRAAAML
jgi:hypothetical protein